MELAIDLIEDTHTVLECPLRDVDEVYRSVAEDLLSVGFEEEIIRLAVKIAVEYVKDKEAPLRELPFRVMSQGDVVYLVSVEDADEDCLFGDEAGYFLLLSLQVNDCNAGIPFEYSLDAEEGFEASVTHCFVTRHGIETLDPNAWAQDKLKELADHNAGRTMTAVKPQYSQPQMVMNATSGIEPVRSQVPGLDSTLALLKKQESEIVGIADTVLSLLNRGMLDELATRNPKMVKFMQDHYNTRCPTTLNPAG
jgi:hypothetical protein